MSASFKPIVSATLFGYFVCLLCSGFGWSISTPAETTPPAEYMTTSTIGCAGNAQTAPAAYVVNAYSGSTVIQSATGTSVPSTPVATWSVGLPPPPNPLYPPTPPPATWPAGQTITIKLVVNGNVKDEVDVKIVTP